MSEYNLDRGLWYHSYPVMDDKCNEKIVDDVVYITSVPVNDLLETYEDLVLELSEKEVELGKLKEQYAKEEFEIMFVSKDIDFKTLYGSTAEKVRKQHAKEVLSDMDNRIQSLELSIGWIKNYIPLLKEVIHSKRG